MTYLNHLACLNPTNFLIASSYSDLPLSNQQPMNRTMNKSSQPTIVSLGYTSQYRRMSTSQSRYFHQIITLMLAMNEHELPNNTNIKKLTN